MHLSGQYVGSGLGDISEEVAKITDFIIRKWDRFDSVLAPHNRLFTESLQSTIAELQGIYKANGTLTSPFIPGVINLATKYAIGYLKKDVLLPLYWSIEGHMSDPNLGPMAWVGDVLQAEGRALHRRTFYDRTALPFKNETGVESMANMLRQTTLEPDGVKFPPGTPWSVGAFSQGAMVWCEFYWSYLAPGKELNWRLKDLRFALVAGNPYREQGVCAEWIPDPPAPDRRGIMDKWVVNTPPWWKEIARKGDMYTDNQSTGEVGLNKTAIAKIITKGSFTGGPAGFLARVTDLFTIADDIIPLAMSVYQAMAFVVDMSPHGAYDMDPAVRFARERLAAPPIAA